MDHIQKCAPSNMTAAIDCLEDKGFDSLINQKVPAGDLTTICAQNLIVFEKQSAKYLYIKCVRNNERKGHYLISLKHVARLQVSF